MLYISGPLLPLRSTLQGSHSGLLFSKKLVMMSGTRHGSVKIFQEGSGSWKRYSAKFDSAAALVESRNPLKQHFALCACHFATTMLTLLLWFLAGVPLAASQAATQGASPCNVSELVSGTFTSAGCVSSKGVDRFDPGWRCLFPDIVSLMEAAPSVRPLLFPC